MKNIIATAIICAAFTYSCKQNSSNTAKNNNIKTVDSIENTISTKNKDSLQTSIIPAKYTIRRPVLDSINVTGTDGKILKILVYEYLYPDNKKYLRDFDIVNPNDSVILSAMKKEYHWEGDVSADDIGQINIVPSYYLKSDSIVDMTLVFYINPYDIAQNLNRYDISGVKEYLSYSFEEYLFEDSVMTFMDFSLGSNNIGPVKFLVKPNNEEIITNDSIFNILKKYKQNTSWGLTAVINGSMKNIIHDKMSFDQLQQIKLLYKYHPSNSDLSINRYFIQSIVYHRNNRDYSKIYKD